MPNIEELAVRQLDAYNRGDLEAFAQCYHREVLVLHGEEPAFNGRDELRERYRVMFESWSFGATVSNRLVSGTHCVDLEHWWRVNPETNERSEGDLIVRYTLRDDLIGTVQFLK